jgi:hypothetical protein
VQWSRRNLDLYCIFTVQGGSSPSVEAGMASKVIVTLEGDLDGVYRFKMRYAA